MISLALTVLLAAGVAESAERPNVLFLMSDDHGWQAISAYGRPDGVRLNHTPSIDRLAHEGRRFDTFFVENSICAPSRAAFLSGCFSTRHGVPTNAEVFDGNQPTWPALLQANGYRTGVIGKWHLKSDPVGFDKWNVLVGQGPYYNPPFKHRDGTTIIDGYTTDIITRLGVETLRGFVGEQRKDGKPFALLIQHKAPHRRWDPSPDNLRLYDDVVIPEPPTLLDDYAGRSPASTMQEMTVARHLDARDLKLQRPARMTATQRAAWDAYYDPINKDFLARIEDGSLSGDALTRAKFQRYAKDYLACVASVDEGVGTVLDELDRLGVADNTIVIYTSDQGWYLGEHGWYDKRWMYEESFRTPFLMRWPGVIPAGTTSSALLQNIDLAPTLLDLAGVATPPRMHGKSFVEALANDGSSPNGWRDAVYYRYYESHGPHRVPKHDGVRTERWKLIWFPEVDPDGDGPRGIGCFELYDLENDPDERTSLAGDPAYAEIQEKLEARLVDLRKQYA